VRHHQRLQVQAQTRAPGLQRAARPPVPLRAQQRQRWRLVQRAWQPPHPSTRRVQPVREPAQAQAQPVRQQLLQVSLALRALALALGWARVRAQAPPPALACAPLLQGLMGEESVMCMGACKGG